MPKFFLPGPGPAEGFDPEDIYEGIRKGAELDTSRKATDRRIFKLRYRHNGRDYEAEVGKPDPIDGDMVFAILDMGDLFTIRCRIRGVAKVGEPILVGKGDAYEVVEFDPPD
jgi:hypothetical protein